MYYYYTLCIIYLSYSGKNILIHFIKVPDQFFHRKASLGASTLNPSHRLKIINICAVELIHIIPLALESKFLIFVIPLKSILFFQRIA